LPPFKDAADMSYGIGSALTRYSRHEGFSTLA
jgi:hypothetical protein